MRYTAGGTPADMLVQSPSANGNVHKSLPNQTGGTLWSAQVGGSQYADLVALGTDPTPITTDADGFIRPFLMPDGVEGGWVDFGGGRRYLKGREVGTVAASDTRYARFDPTTKQVLDGNGNPVTGGGASVTNNGNGTATVGGSSATNLNNGTASIG